MKPWRGAGGASVDAFLAHVTPTLIREHGPARVRSFLARNGAMIRPFIAHQLGLDAGDASDGDASNGDEDLPDVDTPWLEYAPRGEPGAPGYAPVELTAESYFGVRFDDPKKVVVTLSSEELKALKNLLDQGLAVVKHFPLFTAASLRIIRDTRRLLILDVPETDREIALTLGQLTAVLLLRDAALEEDFDMLRSDYAQIMQVADKVYDLFHEHAPPEAERMPRTSGAEQKSQQQQVALFDAEDVEILNLLVAGLRHGESHQLDADQQRVEIRFEHDSPQGHVYEIETWTDQRPVWLARLLHGKRRGPTDRWIVLAVSSPFVIDDALLHGLEEAGDDADAIARSLGLTPEELHAAADDPSFLTAEEAALLPELLGAAERQVAAGHRTHTLEASVVVGVDLVPVGDNVAQRDRVHEWLEELVAQFRGMSRLMGAVRRSSKVNEIQRAGFTTEHDPSSTIVVKDKGKVVITIDKNDNETPGPEWSMPDHHRLVRAHRSARQQWLGTPLEDSRAGTALSCDRADDLVVKAHPRAEFVANMARRGYSRADALRIYPEYVRAREHAKRWVAELDAPYSGCVRGSLDNGIVLLERPPLDPDSEATSVVVATRALGTGAGDWRFTRHATDDDRRLVGTMRAFGPSAPPIAGLKPETYRGVPFRDWTKSTTLSMNPRASAFLPLLKYGLDRLDEYAYVPGMITLRYRATQVMHGVGNKKFTAGDMAVLAAAATIAWEEAGNPHDAIARESYDEIMRTFEGLLSPASSPRPRRTGEREPATEASIERRQERAQFERNRQFLENYRAQYIREFESYPSRFNWLSSALKEMKPEDDIVYKLRDAFSDDVASWLVEIRDGVVVVPDAAVDGRRRVLVTGGDSRGQSVFWVKLGREVGEIATGISVVEEEDGYTLRRYALPTNADLIRKGDFVALAYPPETGDAGVLDDQELETYHSLASVKEVWGTLEKIRKELSVSRTEPFVAERDQPPTVETSTVRPRRRRRTWASASSRTRPRIGLSTERRLELVPSDAATTQTAVAPRRSTLSKKRIAEPLDDEDSQLLKVLFATSTDRPHAFRLGDRVLLLSPGDSPHPKRQFFDLHDSKGSHGRFLRYEHGWTIAGLAFFNLGLIRRQLTVKIDASGTDVIALAGYTFDRHAAEAWLHELARLAGSSRLLRTSIGRGYEPDELLFVPFADEDLETMHRALEEDEHRPLAAVQVEAHGGLRFAHKALRVTLASDADPVALERRLQARISSQVPMYVRNRFEGWTLHVLFGDSYDAIPWDIHEPAEEWPGELKVVTADDRDTKATRRAQFDAAMSRVGRSPTKRRST